jgi:biofilm PGA synthesis N-glycosyltransferase PgaC
VTSEVVVLTEPDSLWARDSLKTAVSYFSDAHIAAVTGIKEPFARDPREKTVVESSYRTYYNLVRVAESKIDSTPVFHGELSAFRTDLLETIGGFPTNVGADDSYTATTLALRGFRSIAVPEIIVYELTPVSRLGYLEWKKRRAVHLIQSFRKLAATLWKARPSLRRVFFAEFFLHVVNPWLLLAAAIAFPISILTDGLSFYHLAILSVIAVVLTSETGRNALKMWVTEQVILVYASLSGLFSNQLIWPKIQELRSDSGYGRVSDSSSAIPAAVDGID